MVIHDYSLSSSSDFIVIQDLSLYVIVGWQKAQQTNLNYKRIWYL